MTNYVANVAVVMKNNNLQMRVWRLNGGDWGEWLDAIQVGDVGHGCVWKLDSTGSGASAPITCVQFQPKPVTSA